VKGIIRTKDGAVFVCKELGGPGSGNFDHAGIPGQQGGSAPGGSGGGGTTSERRASKEGVVSDKAHKVAVGKLGKYYNPDNNWSIEISESLKETTGLNINFEEIQSAGEEFQDEIKGSKKTSKDMVVKIEDIATSSDNSVALRAVAIDYAMLYGYRVGVPVKYNNSDVAKGTIPHSVFDDFYR